MLRSLLAGQDGPQKRALPAGEFFHPLPLGALAVLILNDWWLKGSTWAPAALTGKLSDFAGLLFFPLLLTSLWDCLLLGLFRLGARVDFTLRRRKLIAAIALTGLCFATLKLSPAANHAAVQLAGQMGLSTRIVLDASDLWALPMLWLSWRIGRSEIARVPLGRLELIEERYRRDGVVAGVFLHDIVPAGADPGQTRELIDAIDEYLRAPSPETATRIERQLATVRDLSPKRP